MPELDDGFMGTSIDSLSYDQQKLIIKIKSLLCQPPVTDIHITEGEYLWIRKNGVMMVTKEFYIPMRSIEGIWVHVFKENNWNKTEGSCSFQDEESGIKKRIRYRMSNTLGRKQLFIRILADHAPSFEMLGYNKDLFYDILHQVKPGITVVAGATGSGKSTLLASILQNYADTQKVHICTVEDPVEYVLYNGKGEVSQRNIPEDSPTMNDAIKAVLREDPDIILVGEIRDRAAAETALAAAETGHSVFTTVHAGSVSVLVQRLLGMITGVEGGRERLAAVLLHGLHLSYDVDSDGKIIRRYDMLSVDEVARKYILEEQLPALEKELVQRNSFYQTRKKIL